MSTRVHNKFIRKAPKKVLNLGLNRNVELNKPENQNRDARQERFDKCLIALSCLGGPVDQLNGRPVDWGHQFTRRTS